MSHAHRNNNTCELSGNFYIHSVDIIFDLISVERNKGQDNVWKHLHNIHFYFNVSHLNYNEIVML